MKEVVTLRNAIYGFLALALSVALACGAPTEQQASPAPADSGQAAQQEQQPQQPAAEQPTVQATLALPSGMSDTKAGGAAPTAVPAPTEVQSETLGKPVQADLRVAITPPYAENLLGWRVGGTNHGASGPQRNYGKTAPAESAACIGLCSGEPGDP